MTTTDEGTIVAPILTIEEAGKTRYEFMYPENELSFDIPWNVLKNSGSIVQQSRSASRTKPVDSWDFIQKVEATLHEYDVLYERKPIQINSNSCRKVLNSQQKIDYKDKHVPIDRWIFDKLIMMFEFINEGHLKPGIAFSLGSKGFEMGFGYNVDICQNLCIFAEHRQVYSTFAGSQFHDQQSMDGMLYNLVEWLKNYEQELSIDRQIIRAMIETDFNMDDNWSRLIGDLYRFARKGLRSSAYVPPIQNNNLGEINDKIEAKSDLWKNINTVWGVYNLITSVLKPGEIKMDIGNSINYHLAFSNYLINTFINPFVNYQDLSADLSDISPNQISDEIYVGQEILA